MAQDGQDKDDWLGHSKSGPSPLVVVAMAGVRATLLLLAALLVFILGALLWSKHTATGFVFEKGDYGMMVLIAVLAAGCAIIALLIGREMRKR